MVRPFQILLGLFFCAAFSSIGLGQAVEVRYNDASGDINDVIDIDVRVEGFTDVTSFTLVTNWDATLLEFVELTNQNTVVPVSDVFYGTPMNTPNDNRVVATFSQVDLIPYTIPSNGILFTIRLRVITSNQVNTIIDLSDGFPSNEFVFTGAIKVTPTSDPGTISLNGGGGSGSPNNTFAMEDFSGLPGNEVCIPFTAKNMTNLGGFNGILLNFDPTDLAYTRVINRTAPNGTPTINDLNAGAGELYMIYNYIDGFGNGLTTDSTVLYELCFNVLGDCTEDTQLDLEEDAPTIVVIDGDGNDIQFNLEDGTFTVNCCDADVAITPVTCFGGNDGAITLTTNGCQNITNIAWSNTAQTGTSITGLLAGAYEPTITYDGGGSTRVLPAIMVNEPDEITLSSIDISKVVGGTGGVDIEVAGGTPDYTYLWSNAAVTQDLMGIAAGDYSVTITDDADCQAVFGPFSVAAAPVITGVVSDVVCFGTSSGSIDISVTGGVQPYTYDWSCTGTVDANGDISGLSGGACTVTVTDNSNCETTLTFNVGTPPSALTATLGTVNDDDNNDGNGSISLNVSGGWGGYQFTWDDETNDVFPDENPLTGIFGGSYDVTITDANGCEVSLGDIEVDGLRVFASEIEAVQCFGDNNGRIDIAVIGGSGTYSYDWSCPSGIVDANGNISGLTSGSCTVTVTDLVENNSTDVTFTIPGPTEALSVSIEAMCTNNGSDGSLTANVTGGVAPFLYDWNTTPVQMTAEATNLGVGNYTVIIVDSVGCQIMGQASIQNCGGPGQGCYTGMDVITPNGDDRNDFFIIDCASDQENRLRIFTRWGQEVRTYTNYNNSWDGRDEGGNLVDEETYMWVLEVYPSNGNTELYKGAVSVLYNLR